MAVRFDAATDRCTWTGTAPTPSSGLTVTYWAYVSVDRDDFSTMLRLHSSTGATTNINVAMDSGGLLPCIFTGGGSSTGPQSVSVGSWARIAITVTGSTSRIYVALGAAGATQSQDGTVGANAGVSPNSGYTVGGRSIVDGSEWFNGRLACLRIWSAVLTQSEVEAEWASATSVRTSALFADYPLETAGDLTDHSGNGRHLAAGSTSVTTEDGPPISTTVTGTAALTLPSLDSAGAGDLLVGGGVGATLPPVDVAGAGGVTVSGSATTDLPAIGLAAAGGVVVAGDASPIFPALDVSASGLVAVGGTAAAVLPPLESLTAGAVTVPGEAGPVLPELATGIQGTVTIPAVAGAALPVLAVAAQGTVTTPITGTATVVLPALSMASATLAWPPAVTESANPLVAVDGPHQTPWLAVD